MSGDAVEQPLLICIHAGCGLRAAVVFLLCPLPPHEAALFSLPCSIMACGGGKLCSHGSTRAFMWHSGTANSNPLCWFCCGESNLWSGSQHAAPLSAFLHSSAIHVKLQW